jgi:penicillin-binding protein 1A
VESAGPVPAPKQRRRRIRKLRFAALVGLLLVLASVAFTFGFVRAVASEIPALDPATWTEEVDGYIYANDGETILAVLRGRESRVLVESDEISPWMKQAIVAIEDRRFYDHRGIDIRGVARALWADIRNQAVVQGGSTITQQFVKNAWVEDERTLARKVREAALAWQLEDHPDWSKDRILTAYLNTIYFGNGAYGIQRAAKVYFGKGADKLTLAEAALLAGIPADPARYDPVTRPRAAGNRRVVVLRTMLEQGDITEADFRAAQAVLLPDPEDVRLPGTQGAAPYFANYVKQQLVDAYGVAQVFGGGLRVKTTIDLGLQELAHQAIGEHLNDEDGPSAALVALNPNTGSVLAMVGGRNFRESQFNLAVQGQRQAGSAFKPIVLAAALQNGISPATSFESELQTISLGDRDWVVHNYEETYLGRVNLEQATIHSDNAVYAQLTKLVRPARVVRTAKRLGITSPLQNYFSIGLGGQAANPLELARAYSAFANGGYRIDAAKTGNRPRAVAEVRDETGELVDANRPVRRRVLRPESAALVNDLLRKAVAQGTGKRAQLPGWTVAGKTGTTENYADAWFVGYVRDLVVAVWVGYPNETIPMETEFEGDAVAGGTFPAQIWKSFMQLALPYLEVEPRPFEPAPYPSVQAKLVVDRDGLVQLDNGFCRQRFEVVYFSGLGPQRTAKCLPNEVEVPLLVGERLEAAKARLALTPLTPVLVYKPAAQGQRIDVVLDQIPKKGRLSSWDNVTLVLAKPLEGLVPNLKGLAVAAAQARLRQRGLEAVVVWGGPGKPGRVVSQKPAGGVAAERGMQVRLVVGGDRTAAVAISRR